MLNSQNYIRDNTLRIPTDSELEDLQAMVSSYQREPIRYLDQPIYYLFRPRETVYIRTTGGRWHVGQVNPHPKIGEVRVTGPKNLYYSVTFGNIRKYFSPLNGDIKPYTDEVHNLFD